MKKIDDLAEGLRQGMRHLASGVCIVSAGNNESERAAMTASSLTSVSDDPASLLVCINKSAQIENVLAESAYFSVNILSSEQQTLSDLCATPGLNEERFEQGNWQQHESSGLYILPESPAVFICSVQVSIEHGTHNIYVANVEAAYVSDKKHQALVYADGKYHYL
ncbi:flavin reductase family protein [Agaribacterium sp. ZY112]|uniref:flavin reductase family protein n=1 Tax=Agaribacterium sp. ZY112 TaxID=3233574 RepID=UPI0035246091